jgi:predicted regulator of Ras-like GTPase activity (Roadblock/LC7/MglB family)
MESLLRQIFNVEGVTGALLASKDGLIITTLAGEADGEAHAAHAAAAFDALTHYTRQVTLGKPQQAFILTGTEALVLTEAGDMILVVIAHANANLGRLRLESTRIAHAVLAQLRG